MTAPGDVAARLRDLEALRALPQRYARAVDARDVDALAAMFHPDATIEGTRGPQPLEEWLASMRAPRTFPTSMHLLGDPLVDLADGADAAGLDTYAVVYQLGDASAGQGDLTLGVRYHDEVVRDGDRWLIRRRRADTLWMR